MIPDEYRRLGAVEQRLAISEERDRVADERARTTDARLDRMENKIDTLLEAMNMGKGAWKAFLKLGALLVAVLGAAAWAWQNILSPLLIGKH